MELIKIRRGAFVLALIVLLCSFSIRADADIGVLATVCADSWWDGDCHYYKYYVIRDEIKNVSGADSIEYSYSDHTSCSMTRYSSEGPYTYYYTRIDEYYDYYPTLASAASKNSFVTSAVGDGASFSIRRNMDAFEQVRIDHDVTIFGEEHTLTNRGENMDILYAVAGTVYISDLKLNGNQKICNVDRGTGVGSACITNNGADLTLKNCEVFGSHNSRSEGKDSDAGGTGIECFSGNTFLSECRISDCDGFGVYVGNWRSPADCAGSRIRVENCTIYDCAGGIGNAYGAEVSLDGGSISATRWYKRGIYNSADGTFHMTSGDISDCDQGIVNQGSFFLSGGELYDNKVGIFQDGRLMISGAPRLSVDGNKNAILLAQGRIIEVDGVLTGKKRIGSILLFDTDLGLGRELIRVTYDTPDDEILSLDTRDIASRFVPAFDEVPDTDVRNEEGRDASGYLSEENDEVTYTHPEDNLHPPAFRAGAGYDEDGKLYNGQLGTVVLSECLRASFDLNSNITDVELSMEDPEYSFYWMEPLIFPTKRSITATLYGKNVDKSLALLGWSLRPDGSLRVYPDDEIMSMPNDFTFYPVLDASMAMTYHSNYRLPQKEELSYQVYPSLDGVHSENIIRGNTGPDDDKPDYLVKAVETVFDDINYGAKDGIIRYRHMGWCPTDVGITYRNAEETDPMTHLYVRDEGGDMRLSGDIAIDDDRHIKENDRRLFRLRFLSDSIAVFGADYTDDGMFFNIHMYSVWDEAPYLCVKNVEILEGDVERSLKDMLMERIQPGDGRHEKSDAEDEYGDISIRICDIDEDDFLNRFENLGDMGSVTVDYEAWDMAGNHSVYPVKVTVLSGDHPMVLKKKDDVNSGFKRSAFYYRFIDEGSVDTLLEDSLWRVQREYKTELDKAFQNRGEN